MLKVGQRIKLRSWGSERFGYVETVTDSGAILRLFDGSSAFVQASRNYRVGDCVPYGLFVVTTI